MFVPLHQKIGCPLIAINYSGVLTRQSSEEHGFGPRFREIAVRQHDIFGLAIAEYTLNVAKGKIRKTLELFSVNSRRHPSTSANGRNEAP